MEKQKTIYVLTSGEYSDYHINGVYSSRELAQAFIDAVEGKLYPFGKRTYSDYMIEEYNLDEYADELKRGYLLWFVRMKRDGLVLEAYEDERSYIMDHLSGDQNRDFVNRCLAKDKEHAIKITNERRIQFLANEQ